MSHINYKTGDVDSVGMILKENEIGINLTGYTVIFVMKNTGTSTKYTITCTQGGIVNGSVVPFSSGGVTVPFSSTNTALSGNFIGEFVLSKASSVIHLPSYPDYVTVSITDSL